MLVDPDFMPFEPPARSSLRAMRRNFIESIPRSAYEQAVTRERGPLTDTLLVCDPDLIHEVLVQGAERFGRNVMTRRALLPVLSESSIFLAEGSEWRWQRRAVSAPFRHETVLSCVPVIADAARRQIERWRIARRPPAVEVGAAMGRTTFEIIVETMLGGSAALDVDRYGQALNDVFESIPWQLILALLSAPDWVPFPGRRRLMKARDYLHRETGRIIAQRRTRPAEHRDLLDLLIEARDPETGRALSDAELMTNLLTFITAGHETSAVALTWSLWLLAKDHDAQARVFDEVRAVGMDDAIGEAELEGLVFTKQVIQEAMRLYPPAPLVLRQANVEASLGDHRVEAGTHVYIPTFALHRNRRLWDNPHAFDPQRFTPERAKARSRYAYLPFGAGPRICIGASFALIESTVILAMLVRAYRFRPVPGRQPKPITRLTLRPEGGMPLLIEDRRRTTEDR